MQIKYYKQLNGLQNGLRIKSDYQRKEEEKMQGFEMNKPECKCMQQPAQSRNETLEATEPTSCTCVLESGSLGGNNLKIVWREEREKEEEEEGNTK